MSDPKWAYCAEFPSGKLFETGNVPKGWVDSPAKIKTTKKKVVKKKAVKK